MSGHWAFIIPAYAVAVSGVLALLLASFSAMRRAEARAQALKEARRR